MKRLKSIGIIIGRFQVPDLHYAHIKIIYDIMNKHRKTIILVGSCEALGTDVNPLDFKTRKQMIEAQFPDVIVDQIRDRSDDTTWSKDLDLKIVSLCKKNRVVIYGGRDSFLDHYNGRYAVSEFPKVNHFRGTFIRKEVGKIPETSSSFRKGCIYTTQNQYPRVFMCVDVAVVDKSNYCVLVGRKKGEAKWRFIGGFVDVKDESLEHACRRELYEETNIEAGSFKYVGSFKINDWRYRNSKDTITTAFFSAEYIYGSSIKPSDDIAELKWLSTNKKNIDCMVDNHKKMYRRLIGE